MSIETQEDIFIVDAEARWSGGQRGAGSLTMGEAVLPFTIPEELDGLGGSYTPESLLAAAAASCYAATLALVAQARGLHPRELAVRAETNVERVGHHAQIVGLTLRPHLVLEPGEELPPGIFERTEHACLVSQVIGRGVKVSIEPDDGIGREEAPSADPR